MPGDICILVNAFDAVCIGVLPALGNNDGVQVKSWRFPIKTQFAFNTNSTQEG